MQLPKLTQPGFNTTMMGVLRGALSYYGLPASDAMVYGGSGHAFLMNIHDALCPSGPYCWNRERMRPLIRNLGIDMTDLGFFSSASTPAQRGIIEKQLKELLDSGVPCSLINMENQLILGYDGTGFITAQPWAPHANFPPAHLTFGTWAELAGEVHVNFYSLRKTAQAPQARTFADSLAYAVDLHRNAGAHTDKGYTVGAGAWGAFVAAVKAGHGNSHGNWWNATVWAECRARAADYFREIAAAVPRVSAAADALAADYDGIARNLAKASDKALDSQEKVKLLEQAGATEAGCVERIAKLAAAVG